MTKVLLSWSSGKDSAWALHLLRQRPDLEVVALFTTLNGPANRVAMHAVRRELLEQQARTANLPLWTVELPWPCANPDYERLMAGVCARAAQEGITAVAFGDLFLEEIRAYRVRQLENTGLEALFPLWGLDTSRLAEEMLAAGVRAKVICVDPKQLSPAFAGRDFDQSFLRDLPDGVDACGENGEFHTFVYASPAFVQGPIPIHSGEVIERDGFWFADALPK